MDGPGGADAVGVHIQHFGVHSDRAADGHRQGFRTDRGKSRNADFRLCLGRDGTLDAAYADDLQDGDAKTSALGCRRVHLVSDDVLSFDILRYVDGFQNRRGVRPLDLLVDSVDHRRQDCSGQPQGSGSQYDSDGNFRGDDPWAPARPCHRPESWLEAYVSQYRSGLLVCFRLSFRFAAKGSERWRNDRARFAGNA